MSYSTIEQALHDQLLAYSELSGLIDNRLYAVQIPQNPTYPCAAYQRISTVRTWTHDPPSLQAGGVGFARVQFTIYANGATGISQTLAIAGAIRRAIQSFNLTQLASSPLVVSQAPNFVLGQRSTIEAQTTNQPLGKTIVDVKVWFNDLD